MTDKDNAAEVNLPEKFEVFTTSSRKALMIAVIIVDLGILAFWGGMFFGGGYLNDIFKNHNGIGWAVMAVIIVVALTSIFSAINSGFCSNLKIDGDVLTAGGKSFKRDDLTGMVRSGRGGKNCKIMAGSKTVCKIEDSWQNFSLLQRWMQQ